MANEKELLFLVIRFMSLNQQAYFIDKFFNLMDERGYSGCIHIFKIPVIGILSKTKQFIVKLSVCFADFVFTDQFFVKKYLNARVCRSCYFM